MRGWKWVLPAVCLFSIGFIYVLFLLPVEQEPSAELQAASEPVFEPRKKLRDVTPDKMVQAPVIEEDYLQRLPAVEPPPPPEKPPEPTIWHRPIVLAAGILKSRDIRIELEGIEPIALDRECVDQTGTTWPCGRMAKTEFGQFVRGRSISCDPVEDPGETIIGKCQLGGFDISAWLVLTGWAMPKGDAFSEELKTAEKQERGKWRKTAP